ncbi:MAG: hypothetical protein IT289_04950 [Oligoflexia bacterium]|nr:hypothetical protein [Oligoflexia bacterium]
MRFEFVEQIDSLVEPEELAIKASKPRVLVITKAGKFLRGHIIDHNVRINSDGRVRGRLVMLIDGQKKDVDANDISSLEGQPN